MPGFEVTYSADPTLTSGWSDIFQQFGNFDCTSCIAPIESDNYALGTELVEIATCVDFLHADGGDLETFRLFQADGTDEIFGANYACNAGIPSDNLIDIGNKLIGFHIRTSASVKPYATISSIALIIDTENCEVASWTTDTLTGLVLTHETNAATTTFPIPLLETVWSE